MNAIGERQKPENQAEPSKTAMQEFKEILYEQVAALTKVRIWFVLLPWLANHFKLESISKISTRRLDYEVLRRNCGYRSEDLILLFTEKGGLIGRVGERHINRQITNHSFLFLRWDAVVPAYESYFSETVLEAIERFQAQDRLKFIIGRFERRGEETQDRLVVSAVPDGETIATWVDKLQREELAAKEKLRISVLRALQDLKSGK